MDLLLLDIGCMLPIGLFLIIFRRGVGSGRVWGLGLEVRGAAELREGVDAWNNVKRDAVPCIQIYQ